MSRFPGLLEWRTSFRCRLVACVAVGLTCQAAFAPLAAAAMMQAPGMVRSPAAQSAALSAGKQQERRAATPSGGVAATAAAASQPDDPVPELWAPRGAAIVDTDPARGGEALFDGDATTGFTSEAGKSGAVRLDLGSARDVVGIGVHGSGQAKIAIYAEDQAGARKELKTGRDGAIKLEAYHWAQVVPTGPAKTTSLVVQWTAAPAAPVTITELALWVRGRSRQALAEAAIADRLVTELPENAVASTATPASASVARVTVQGPLSASFAVKVEREPRLGRAFLVYEVDKKAHWTGVVRSINGHAVRGGYLAEAKGLGGVQVEEINAAWLKKGDNTIKFEPTLTEEGHGYSVKNVRVVTVPLGVDAPPAPGAKTALSDDDLTTGVGGPGAHTGSLAGRTDREPAFLSFYLDKPTRGTLKVSAEGGAARAQRKGQVSVDLDGRSAGWQTVPVGGVLPASSELSLRVTGDRESTAQIGEARVLSFPSMKWPADLTVSYPLHGECHDHKTYVRGFVSGSGQLQKPQLLVDGKPQAGKMDADGSFDAQVLEPAAGKGKPWSIRLEVAAADGSRRTRTVPIDACLDPPKGRVLGVSPPVEDVGAPYGAVVSPSKASTLDFAGAKLEIPVGAVDSDVRVTMRPLDRTQVPAVQAEMDNVTAGGALRFGPHGLKFKKAIKVTLPIDAARLPQGMTSGDVAAFYLNEANGKWTELPNVVSRRSDRIVAETTHFTDFIASTVKMPEHPDAQQFNPNAMKDMKVGQPGAGITLIEPPQINSRGSASLSYPIETPPARNGIGPSLALTYDSERVHANGWVGVGWNLSGLSVIEIDTRFGVPNYDAQDIYSLDGAMLTSAGTAGVYKKRVEGSFHLIERRGPSSGGTPGTVGGGDPKTYYWTVTDKNGTVYTYGSAITNCGTAVCNSRLTNPRSGTENGRIFRWYLERVQDTYGNFMTISYKHDAFVMTGSSPAETADAVYPYMIDYTARTGLAANYHVEFKLDTNPGTGTAGTRPDITSSARGGFVELTQRRLTDIFVRSGTTTLSSVRHYKLIYEQNAQDLADRMQKSVLSAVALWSSETDDTTELYRHTFEYNKAPATTAAFSGEQTWGQAWQAAAPPQSGYVPRTNDGLSHSVDGLVGGSITLGVGFPYISVTGNFGMDYGWVAPDLAFLGITGQGLPDLVDANGTLSQNSPLLVAPATNHFAANALTNPPSLGGTDRSGWTAGGDISAMGGLFGGGASYARHVQDDHTIITDMNGDGFPDAAHLSGSAFFAYINDGKRNFTPKQWTGYSLADSPFSTAARLADVNVADTIFGASPLIRWVAPFTGQVTINSQADVGNPLDDVVVEFYVANDTGKSTTISAGQGGHAFFATNYVRTINAGDKIYMRAKGVGDHAASSVISWPTSIVYTPPSGMSAGDLDPTGAPLFNFDSANDASRDGGEPRVPWHLTSAGSTGDVGVARCFSKVQTADNINVSYVLRDKTGGVVNHFDLPVSAAAGTTCFPTTTLPQAPNDSNMAMINNVTQDYSLGLEFTSDTPVGFPFGVINPIKPANGHTMKYTWYCRNSACGAPQPAGSGYTIPTDLFAASFPVPPADIAHDTPDYHQNRIVRVFNNNNNTVAQPMRSVSAGSTSVSFTGTLRPNATLTEDVFVLIQSVNRLFKKVKIPAGSTTSQTFSVAAGPFSVASTDRIFASIYSTSAIGGNVSWVTNQQLKMNGTNFDPLRINNVIRDATFDNNLPSGVTTHDPMSGGFHNWFYGDWNDTITFCDHLPVGMPCNNRIVRTAARPQNNDAVMGMVPTQVHEPGSFGEWKGRGGGQIYTRGGNPLIYPGKVSSLAATATSATSMAALRVADTWNLNLRTNAFGVSAGLNGGDSTSQVEFFDFNGDRFPDSITRSGVQFNDGVSAFGSRRGVDMSIGGDTEIRRIQNVALQAGVTTSADGSSRQLITEAEGDGETKKISTTASVSGSADYGVSSTRIDFADVNGDGLVDHVREEPGDSSLRVRLNLGYGFSNEVTWARTCTNQTTGCYNWSAGNASVLSGWDNLRLVLGIPDPGTILNQVPAKSPASTNVVRLQDTGTASAAVGTSLGFIGGGGGPTYSVTRTWVDLMDVNGDGLPDQVLKVPGDPNIRVKLNLGDRFAPEKSWSLPAWGTSPETDFSFLTPDGLAYSTVNGWGKNVSFQVCFWVCFGASGFVSDSKGGSSVQFEDVDGDGDMDQVMKKPGNENVYVKFNNVVKAARTTTNPMETIGPPNLLTAVNRPFKGRFEISYERAGNRVDMDGSFGGPVNMPNNQWVMSGVVLNSDSRTTCPANPPMPENCSRQKFEYKAPWSGKVEGFYDPKERENYGYFTTTTIFPDEDQGTSIESTYQSHNYYKRGLETTKYWYQNATTRVIIRALVNGYNDPSGVDPATLPERTGSFFPGPTSTTTYFYEMVGANKSQTVSRIFDTKGDLTDYIDTGDDDFDTLDDFNYHVDYQTINSTNPSLPWTAKVATGIKIRSGNVAAQGIPQGQRTASFSTQPKPDWVEDVIVGGTDPTTGQGRTTNSPGRARSLFAYDAYGNLQSYTSPNAAPGTTDPDGNARQVTYTYDAATQTYRESSKWSPDGGATFYTSSATYEPKFGLPKSLTDVGGAKQEIDYDNYGRVTKVFAPNDFNSSGARIDTNAPTIAVTYGQVPQRFGGADSVPEWAMVTHRTNVPGEGSYPGDTITARSVRTVNFIDGLNRSIQVKRDISRDDGTTTTPVMSVSGKTVFDPRGRVYQQGLPTYDGPNTPNTFVAVGMTTPTTYSYDVLGRLRQEDHPDAANGMTATTKISYQAGISPLNGKNYLVKMTTDPAYDWDHNYHYRAEYRNVRDQVEFVLEPNAINGAVTGLWTSYFYDLRGRVKQVQDARSNITRATWDWVGNLVKLQSPDSGDSSTAAREWRYCLGGYVCAEKPPRGSSTQLIKSTYDRDRLTRIDYPSIPASAGAPADPVGNPSVVYTYGGTGSADRGTISLAGGTNYKTNRITRRTDEAGQFDFDYDALGNTISETALLKKTSSTNYQSYQTKYQWDNFGRLVDVTIPGTASPSTPGEIIRYGYDAGGAVASARGRLTPPAANTTFDYVNHVGYNEFGERVRITYGNGAVSTYSYYPDTRRLSLAETKVQDTMFQDPRSIQQLNFYYDVLGNVSARYQAAPTDDDTGHAVRAGGYSQQWFNYDPLNQLTGASLYTQRTSIADDYANVSINYDEIGNITQKIQTQGGDFSDGQGNWFSYSGGSHQYTLTPHYDGTAFNPSPHAPSTIDEERDWGFSTRSLTYDKNGNVEKQVQDTTERRIRWTDGDRIRSICEGTPGGTCAQLTESRYAADGTRTHQKTYSGPTTSTETLYLNQYLTVRNGTLPTKHVYLGDARVASKVETNQSSSGNNTYWYHSDHIQNTQYVTTKGSTGGPPARVTQYLEFFPGGEIFYEETGQPATMLDIAHATTFTGKEMDQRTGYYNFGARYYEPTMQMWLSPDPILASYMKGHPNDGVFLPINLGLYTYTYNNPVKLVDPDGNAPKWLENQDDGYQDRGGVGWRAPFGCTDCSGDAPKLPPSPNFPERKGPEQPKGANRPGTDGAGGRVGKDAPPTGSRSGQDSGAGGSSGGASGGAGGGDALVRRGADAETATRLGKQAHEAECAGCAQNGVEYGHGVSVTTPASNARLAKDPTDASSATRQSFEDAGFPVRHTPTSRDPNHHTVQLPKPVTPADAAKFNNVLGRPKK